MYPAQKQSPVPVFVLLLSLLFAPLQLRSQELPNLPPVTAEDLSLKDIPSVPGVAAAILYYAVETDNTKSSETRSVRLKVFREQGRERANIEIPYAGKEVQLDSIRARTIDPQGKPSEFSGEIFDREIVKAKKYRYGAKVFTLPNVQIGTIIEYSYHLQFKQKIPDAFKHPEQYLVTASFTYPAATWPVQQNLFVRHAHFVLHKAGTRVLEHNFGFSGVEFSEKGNGILQLDFDNIPAYEEEEYSPPEDSLMARVDLYYAVGFFGPSGFWMDCSKRWAKDLEPFLKKSKTVEREAARLVSLNDSDETKLRKLYARVQQIRAVSFEAAKTDKERKQENLNENKNVEDVLNRGYAFANQINLLFVALARAAGFEAYPFMVTSRRNGYFLDDWPNESQLTAMVVQVRNKNGFLYLDPATKFCPFGLLPWDEADSGGIRIDAVYPASGTTSLFKSADALRTRNAEFRLSEDGSLEGKVEVLYTGQEALLMRLEAVEQDDAARRKTLEDSLKKSLAPEATVNLQAMEGWQYSEGPLKASFEVEIPNFASRVGRRLVLPLGVFHANQRNPFVAAKRTNPIYFSYPQEDREEVKIELPDGMQLESSPTSAKSDQNAVYYELSVSSEGKTLRLNRTIRFNAYLFLQKHYPAIQIFYNRVFAGDSQQITLIPRTEHASN
jgi:hypothetical protein